MISQKMFINTIKNTYHVDNIELSIILKCTEERVSKLSRCESEITTYDVIRICDHYNIRGKELEELVIEGQTDNDLWKKSRRAKK